MVGKAVGNPGSRSSTPLRDGRFLKYFRPDDDSMDLSGKGGGGASNPVRWDRWRADEITDPKKTTSMKCIKTPLIL